MSNFSIQLLKGINEISEKSWDMQLPPCKNPFLSWRFLHACEESGSSSPNTGWTPKHLILRDNNKNHIGSLPLYLKSHSQGEYVFDHGWAQALERVGENYYPKLQCSIPFTPVSGPRLLTKGEKNKAFLSTEIIKLCEKWGLSGIHFTFLQDEDLNILKKLGFSHREDRQFHFLNRGYNNFDNFLNSLSSRKRKNIKKERQIANEGVTIKRLSGDDIKEEHWDYFWKCYIDTSFRKWGRPYLTRYFFEIMQDTMRDDIILIMAFEGDQAVGAALNYIGSDTIYGRNWGSLTYKPCLHFELCYYQAIEAAIEHKLKKVEAGAQGEHKLARGYEPVTTHSAHYLSHPGLKHAVNEYLTRERNAVESEIHHLSKHTPFKKG